MIHFIVLFYQVNIKHHHIINVYLIIKISMFIAVEPHHFLYGSVCKYQDNIMSLLNLYFAELNDTAGLRVKFNAN